MKRKFTIALALFLSLSFTPVHAEEEPGQPSPLDGAWIFSSGVANGQSLDDLLRKKGIDRMTFTFSDGLMTMSGFGAPDHTYRFTVRPMDTPSTIRMVTVETHGKAPKGTVLTGIYKLDDDQLTLCLPADSSVDSPKKFEAPKGSRQSMLILKRETK